MKTKLKYVILFVEDVAASRNFYAEAFELPVGFAHEGGDYGEMQTGETTLSFSSRKLMQQLGKNPDVADPAAPSFEIAFEVDDVPGALARALRAGAQLVQEVKEEAWGQTTSYVSDPDGYLVEICSPVAAS
jgi:lactoylglutathione lyase